MACKHRAAGDEYRWDIKAGSSHEHPRNDLVAVRDEYKRIEDKIELYMTALENYEFEEEDYY